MDFIGKLLNSRNRAVKKTEAEEEEKIDKSDKQEERSQCKLTNKQDTSTNDKQIVPDIEMAYYEQCNDAKPQSVPQTKIAKDDIKNHSKPKSVRETRVRPLRVIDSSDSENTNENESKEFETFNNKIPGSSVDISGIVTFAVESVNPYLVCSICFGYFREPFTITECLHTSCKSCIYLSFHSGNMCCPMCNTDLRPDPYKRILFDRTMNDIVNKIFPSLERKDTKDLMDFYERRGIKRKHNSKNDEKQAEKAQPSQPLSLDDPVEAILLPETDTLSKSLPPLEKPYLRAPGKMKISQLKKYIAMKMKDQNINVNSIVMFCRESLVGDDLNLNFIQRTKWDDSLGSLVLLYRINVETFF